MAISTTQNAESFFDIEEGVPVNNHYPLFHENEVRVIYGIDALEAILNVDYEVEISEPDFDQFTITPTASLLTKINDLINDDPDEINYITVRRTLPLTTSTQPNTIANTTYLSREIDRLWMALIGVTENLQLKIGLPASQVGDPLTQYYVDPPEEGKATIWQGNKLVPGPDAADIQNAEGFAEDAEAARDLAEDYKDASELAKQQAEAALLATQAIADGLGFRDVIFKTFADSPYTVTAADKGKMISVDTSGGNVIIDLPQISGLTMPFNLGVKKSTPDTNTLTLRAYNGGDGTNKIDGQNTKTFSSVSGASLIPDTDPSPDAWTSSEFGAQLGQISKTVLTNGGGFTAGTSTSFTGPAGQLLYVAYDGLMQHSSQFSQDPVTGVVTANAAVPLFVTEIEVATAALLPIGVTGDNTVTAAKIVDGVVGYVKLAASAIASAADLIAGTASKLVTAAEFKAFYDAYIKGGLGTQQVTTSGTSFDFTDIPAGVNRIEIMFDGVSLSGTDEILIQIGDSGGIENTGYVGKAMGIDVGFSYVSPTNAFSVRTTSAGLVVNGKVSLQRMDGNKWMCTGVNGDTYLMVTMGVKTLSDTLDRVRVLASGANTFDAGSINIYWGF